MEKSRLHFPLYLLYSFCWCVILTCHEMHQWGYLHAPMGLSAPMGVSCRINIVCSQSRRVPALRAKPGNPGYGFRRARWRDTVADPADAAHCEEVRIPSCRLPGHASAGSLSPARRPNRSASEPAVPQVLRRAGFDGPTVDRVRARVQEVADRWNAGPPRPPPPVPTPNARARVSRPSVLLRVSPSSLGAARSGRAGVKHPPGRPSLGAVARRPVLRQPGVRPGPPRAAALSRFRHWQRPPMTFLALRPPPSAGHPPYPRPPGDPGLFPVGDSQAGGSAGRFPQALPQTVSSHGEAARRVDCSQICRPTASPRPAAAREPRSAGGRSEERRRAQRRAGRR